MYYFRRSFGQMTHKLYQNEALYQTVGWVQMTLGGGGSDEDHWQTAVSCCTLVLMTNNITVAPTVKSLPDRPWWRVDSLPVCQSSRPRPGEPCPFCGQGILDYDGLFLLSCPVCGQVAEKGSFT